ncbi:MAG: heterodisulfide reductase subunit F [Anaerolineae bacterium SM23_84]|nr:MAG: heterodisulfide reductase subunit F [Anaerolineae bacterium SM23_84]
MDSLYLPHCMTINEIIEETPDVKTFRLAFADDDMKERFDFRAGQFGLYSVFGQGEAPFCISNSPTRKEYIECSIKRVGRVTNAFHELNVGDTVGFRGPYGNSFPLEEMRGKNLIFAGGGIGLAPLRSLVWNCIDTRKNFRDITIVYGARSTADLVYKRELSEWVKMKRLNTVLTVDPGGEDETWEGEIGFVPTVLEQVGPSPKNAVVITCGPPIMIKFVLVSLQRMGFTPDQVITTLEMKMKCGLGKCGRCNIGSAYVCKQGPVFSYEQLKELPAEY